MRLSAVAVLLGTLTLSAQTAETRSTMCQTTNLAPIGSDVAERKLVGCGEGFPDNLLWHLDRADSVSGALDGKFTRKLTGRGAVIYFVDTGVMAAHDEFAREGLSSVIGGTTPNGSNGCGPTNPCWFIQNPITLIGNGHGTSAASVAAGQIVGIAPGALVVAANNSSDAAGYAAELKRIVAHAYAPTTPGFRTGIINVSGALSIGNPNAPELDALIRRMTTGVDANGDADPDGKRFLFVAIAGNAYPGETFHQCGPDNSVIVYPGTLGPSIEGVVLVGGIDRDNHYWSGACRSDFVEVAAPAHDLFTASIGSKDAYRWKPDIQRSGTSWSGPYVSGIAAMLLELDPSRTPAQLEALLKASPSKADGVPVPIFPEPPVPESGPRRRSVRK